MTKIHHKIGAKGPILPLMTIMIQEVLVINRILHRTKLPGTVITSTAAAQVMQVPISQDSIAWEAQTAVEASLMTFLRRNTQFRDLPRCHRSDLHVRLLQ